MKIKLTCIVLFFVICLGQLVAYGQNVSKQPNILIILSDDQGWGDVGFNGGKDIPTPNLDMLAEDGIIFSQGYATHPYCSPSRAGLVSGRYQQRFGHENNPIDSNGKEDSLLGLPLNELIISELLQKNNYRTCAIGKWHLGNAEKYWPSNRGFDDWYGFTDGGLNYWGDLQGKDKMLGVLRDGVPVPANKLTYLTDDFSNEAVKYIDTYSKNENPFFMYLAYNAPHAPIQATKIYTEKVKHIEDGERAAYAAMVVGMDAGIGKVIQKLKDTGEYENTIIFFYSDNGGHIHGARSAPFRGHKGMLFEGGIREPFVISWPKKIIGGKTFKEPIIALDIFPTILAAANINKPKDKKIDGINLLPYLKDDSKKIEPRLMYWRYSGGKGYAIRNVNYKLIYSRYKEEYLLFDIGKDPYEHHNIASNFPEIVNDLKEKYNMWNTNNMEPLWSDPHIKNVKKEEKKRQYFIDKATKGEQN